MTGVVIVLGLLLIVGALFYASRTRSAGNQTALADAQAEARRWVERLGGQVLNLVGSTDAAKQALADASERYTAAGSQLQQAGSVAQYRLATETAMEGLYYVRAARVAMNLDPGPELPDLSGQRNAGRVTEDRQVTLEGRHLEASPQPGAGTPHYYPGGVIAGRPVPQGWYSEPWWKPALRAGAWGVGGFLLADALFGGMSSYGMGGFDGGGLDGGGFDGGFDGGGFDGGGFDFDW